MLLMARSSELLREVDLRAKSSGASTHSDFNDSSFSDDICTSPELFLSISKPVGFRALVEIGMDDEARRPKGVGCSEGLAILSGVTDLRVRPAGASNQIFLSEASF